MNTKVVIIFLAIALLSASAVNAIGISPSRIVLNFTPSMELARDILVINNENHDLSVRLYARGDLAQYVTLPVTTATLSPQSNKAFSYTVKLPSWLAGQKKYDTRIGAVEVAAGNGTFGAVAGVEMQLWINVSETPRPAIVYGELPPLEAIQPTNNQINQTSPATELPVETAQPQAISLGLILIYVGAALGIVVVIAGALLMVKGGHRKHRRAK